MTFGRISEATAGSVLTGCFSLGSCAFLVIPLKVHKSLNVIMTFFIAVTLAVVALVPVKSRRSERKSQKF